MEFEENVRKEVEKMLPLCVQEHGDVMGRVLASVWEAGTSWAHDYFKQQSGWQPIETAPVGEPGIEVGSRNPSKWFLAKDQYGVKEVRRKGNKGEFSYEFEDKEHTYYATDYFEYWAPLPPPPTDNSHRHCNKGE